MKPPRKETAKPRTEKISTAKRPSSALTSAAASEVEPLIERVVTILEQARSQVIRAVNSAMVLAYWQIGREIVEFVQRGATRAGYGEQVLDALSARLRDRVGRGYSTTNLRYFRTFYLAFRDRTPEIRHIEGGESGRQPAGALLDIRHKRRGVSGAASTVPSLSGFSPMLGWSHYRLLMNLG